MNVLAERCMAISTHAVSQSLEVGVWFRFATDANAHVSTVTAATSGNLLKINEACLSLV
jgi:hypothetical protein